MNRGGFSIIEIVITITILGILLTLGVVSMNAAQVNARDAERQADVETIAMHFESYYSSSTSEQGAESSNAESYPGTFYVRTPSNRATFFPDLPRDIFAAPGVSDSLVIATNTAESTSSILPQPTTSQYVYQPLSRANTICVDQYLVQYGCSRFNLYYRLEKDNSIQMIKSKNR